MPLDATYIIGRFTRTTPSRGKRALILSDSSVSDQHAELTVLLGTYYLRDLNSTNGIWRLRAGEKVRLRADYVAPEEVVYFGQAGVQVADLLELASRTPAKRVASNSEERRNVRPMRASRHGEQIEEA